MVTALIVCIIIIIVSLFSFILFYLNVGERIQELSDKNLSLIDENMDLHKTISQFKYKSPIYTIIDEFYCKKVVMIKEIDNAPNIIITIKAYPYNNNNEDKKVSEDKANKLLALLNNK